MAKSILSTLAVALAVFGVACAPDLVVRDLEEEDVVWNGERKVKKVVVENVGNKSAGEFYVYVNAEEDPVSPNDRPQFREHVAGLGAGDTIELGPYDFGPKATANNAYLANVKSILVMVDPKGMVKESNEDNNNTEYTFPP